jgi:hypothetical protein
MTNNRPCEGVWIPTDNTLDYPNHGVVRCFIAEFKFKSDYRLSKDHIKPVSLGGLDVPENIHITHLGCQKRQGGHIAGRKAWPTNEAQGTAIYDPDVRMRGARATGNRTGFSDPDTQRRARAARTHYDNHAVLVANERGAAVKGGHASVAHCKRDEYGRFTKR